MNKTQLLEKNIRALVKDGKTLDLEYFVILDELNFAALLQAVRHHAETVFTYRINAANYFGGPNLAMRTVNEKFNMNIQSYVMVNFYGFQRIAERLGGIDIDISEEEMNSIN